MPPRYAYWTIIIDNKPTAFRARERDELLPTFVQLRRTNPDAVMKWFARGRLWDTPEQATWAAQHLHRPLTAADAPRGTSVIVLLGSSTRTAETWMGERFAVLDRESADRVAEAARVYRLLPDAWVISSGGLVDPRSREEASGITMKQTLVQMGGPESRILVEADSRNTHEEAVIVGRMLASLKHDHAVLVTSAVHMRRSVGTFRA